LESANWLGVDLTERAKRIRATTLNGASLKISTTGGVKLNGDVKVTKTDIAASNGLIHCIDSVLIPAA